MSEKEEQHKVQQKVEKKLLKNSAKSKPRLEMKPDANLNILSHNYFQGHDCHLPPERLSAQRLESNGIQLWIFNFMAVHAGDIRAINMHRSYAALCAEKYRHHQNYRYTIHPYSKLRFYIEFTFVVLTIVGSIVIALHYSASDSFFDELDIVDLCQVAPEHLILRLPHASPAITFLWSLIPITKTTRAERTTAMPTTYKCKRNTYNWLVHFVMCILAMPLTRFYRQLPKRTFYPSLQELREDFMYFCDVMIVFNVIANFFTGYIEGYSRIVTVLSMKKIALHYLKTWLIVDLLASAGLLSDFYEQHITLTLVLEAIKLIRIPIILVYLNNILTVMKASFVEKTIVEVLFCLIIFLSWNIYFQFAVEYIIEGSYFPGNPRNCSWLTVGKLWNQTTETRLIYAVDRAVSMLTTNTNMNLLEQKGCLENFLVISWIFSKLIIFHYALKYTLACFGKESASAQYYIMKKQLETYMVQKNFHPRLKSKILKFYAIRFQSKYFEESRMLECVSGQLREDILMHTGRQLVRELDFLKQLPSSLLVQIAVKLRLVIYIAGDIIFKISTVGDCLYFIDRGTVAIYSNSGKEVCHLEDGDYFGEIALVMKQHFRTASVVAVTNCELFRLDREHFETTIAYYPTVYNSIKEVATRRFERTRVLDEHHQAELRTSYGIPPV